MRWMKIVEIRELIAQGVADAAIGFRNLLQPFHADHDVIAIILGRDPEPDDISAVVLDILLRGLRLEVCALTLLALGDLLPVLIHHEAMSQDRFEWSRAI